MSTLCPLRCGRPPKHLPLLPTDQLRLSPTIIVVSLLPATLSSLLAFLPLLDHFLGSLRPDSIGHHPSHHPYHLLHWFDFDRWLPLPCRFWYFPVMGIVSLLGPPLPVIESVCLPKTILPSQPVACVRVHVQQTVSVSLSSPLTWLGSCCSIQLAHSIHWPI